MSNQKEVFPGRALGAFRRCLGTSQDHLIEFLKKKSNNRKWEENYSKTALSLIENDRIKTWELYKYRLLIEDLSDFFIARGFDADSNGNIIYVIESRS